MKTLLFALSLFCSALSFADTNGIQYPERAEALRITGHVNVLYDINVAGKVQNIRIIDVQPKYVFEKEIMKGMKKWQFSEHSPKSDVRHVFTFAAK